VFLEEKLPEMLEEILLARRKNMWFQHNGAVAHLHIRSKNILLSLTTIAE
jgi:hypothetical protein